MKPRWPWLLVLMVLVVLGSSGCRCCRSRCCPAACPPACPPSNGVVPPAANVLAPLADPGAVPAPPQPAPPPSPPPPSPPSEFRGYPPPAAPPAWKPTPGSAAPAEQPSARLNVPQAPAESAERSPSLPVGIPQFTSVRPSVASGMQPLPAGFEWLKANGYRSVLHLRRPAEDDAADRRQAEKLGLKYLSLEISPLTLTRAVVEQFNSSVTDSALQPTFVYDRDGVLAGGMWYLHFRTHERLSDAQARPLAVQLGLKEDAEGEAKAMWLAIQNLQP